MPNMLLANSSGSLIADSKIREIDHCSPVRTTSAMVSNDDGRGGIDAIGGGPGVFLACISQGVCKR